MNQFKQGYWWLRIDGTVHHQTDCVNNAPFDNADTTVEWWYVNDKTDWAKFRREHKALVKKPLKLKRREKDLLF